MVSAEDVIGIYRLLDAAGIRVWLTGGWGIDVLLGDQTRPHKDLDLILLVDDVVSMRALLEREGYHLKELWSENRWDVNADGAEIATAFVLHDDQGHEIDAHAMHLDAQGNGLPAWDVEGFVFSAKDLAGAGTIAGRRIPCLSPAMQVRCHIGYDLPAEQVKDMVLLRDRFGVTFPVLDPENE